MYQSYFGLDEQTFSIAVNPRYLYMSAQHREALAHLLYGVSSGGFVMLSGEVGTGKTTIIRCLLEQLPDIADLAVVMNPSASARDLLCSICDEFHVGYAEDEASLKILTDKLTVFLLGNHSRGRKSIVLIDEAQLLRISTLEQVRLLTNLETNTQKLLQIILVGQPELNELLAKPALRQLSQRITARYHLRPLADSETDAYIKHRLKIGGMPEGHNPFPPNIVTKIHKISRGIPRLVNILCDRMLLGAYSRGVTVVDSAICNQATVEVLGDIPEDSFRRFQPAVFAGVGALSVLILVFIIWLFVGGDSTEDKQYSPEAQVHTIERGAVVTQPTAAQPAVAQAPSRDYWLSSQDRALEGLLSALAIPYDGTLYPCWVISKQGYKCDNLTAANWGEFRQTNRPAVLTITTQGKDVAYVTLVGLKDADAWVSVGGRVQRVPLHELGEMWTGEYVIAWKRPPSYKDAVRKGSKGPLVAWVAEQFAILDERPQPITHEHFNDQLKKRVMIFQQRHRLDDDGVVGFHTLLKLNEKTGKDKSLRNLESMLTGVGS